VIPKVARLCPLPMAAMALWHLDDAYYYWNHYAEALRRARVVLANTRWAAESVWPKFGVEARWAGPGVDDRWAREPSRMGREEWRRSLGLDPVTPVVLSVSRKSAAKRYDLIVEAMQRLRAVGRHPNAMLVLAGPDEDRRPIDAPGVRYVGALGDQALHEAYSNADAFAMMSESESFGMVFAEAWLRRLPVVGNRWCGPVASLIGEGRDGFLASGAADLADALGRLLDDEALRRAMGEAGREKTLRDHTWPSCASRAASALRECVFAG